MSAATGGMMALQPLVSILIPAYNSERFIADTLRSALVQSWPRKEVIVVDDGSDDQTLAIARRFASKTVSVIHQDRQGAQVARNKAFNLSQGEYIQWLDADDLLSRDKISSQMNYFIRGCGAMTLLSAGWAYFRSQPAKARFIPGPLWGDFEPLEWVLRKWETNSHMQTGTWLLSRRLAESAGPWAAGLLVNQDGEYFTRALLRSRRVKFVPEARVYYRISPSNRVSYVGTSAAKLESMLRAIELEVGYVRSVCDDSRTRAACTSYIQNWISGFWLSRPDLVEHLRRLAASWGGTIRPPSVSWKYAWYGELFGLRAALRLQVRTTKMKADALRLWDSAGARLRGSAIDVSHL